MTIAARCQDCEKLYKVEARLAGKRVRCKACGGVVAVPAESAPLDKRAAAPAATSGKSAARHAPTEPDDPFNNLDSLMSLESSGMVEDNPAPVISPSKRRRAPVEPSGADNVLAPAAYSPGRSLRASNDSPASYSPRGWRSAYISLPHEDAIDAYIPVATIGILLVFLVITFIRIMSAANELSDQFPPGFMGVVFRQTLGRFAGILGVTFGLLAPLCMLGVIIASKIMKFEAPGSFYLRCAAVACTPISLIIIVNGFGFGEPTPIGGIVALPVMLGVLWLMFRLRIVSYLVNAGLVLVFLVGVPFVIGMLLHRNSAGFAFSGFGGMNSGNVKDDPNSIQSLSNLRQVGNSLQLYLNDHQGVYPKSLEILVKAEQLDPNLLRSPLGSKPLNYRVPPGSQKDIPGNYAIVDDPNTDGKHAVAVLYADCHAERIVSADYKALEEKNQKALNSYRDGIAAKERAAQALINKPATPARTTPDPINPATIDFPAHHLKVEASLKKVAGELKKYADTHGGKYPMALQEMFQPGGLTIQDLHPGNGSVITYAGQWMKSPLPRELIIVYEQGIKDKKRTIIRGDLSVETIDVATWPDMLQKSNSLRSQLMHP